MEDDTIKGDKLLIALGLSFILLIGILNIVEFSTAYKSEKLSKHISITKIKKGIEDKINEFFIAITILVILILFVFSWLCSIVTTL